MKAVLRLVEGGHIAFFCPGCKEPHCIPAGQAGGRGWSWNGDVVRPTLSPSILVKSGHFVSDHRPGVDTCWCDYNREHPDEPSGFQCRVCHSFVRGGHIEFLSDCSHELAGKTVPLPAWEDRP